MALDTENRWRAISGWVGLYEVSSAGEVRSVNRTVKGRHGPTKYAGRILRPTWTTGYARVNLVNTGIGRREQHYIHDLVLTAYVGPKPPGLEVCHGPKFEMDNSLANLRYDTRKENAADRKRFER